MICRFICIFYVITCITLCNVYYCIVARLWEYKIIDINLFFASASRTEIESNPFKRFTHFTGRDLISSLLPKLAAYEIRFTFSSPNCKNRQDPFRLGVHYSISGRYQRCRYLLREDCLLILGNSCNVVSTANILL